MNTEILDNTCPNCGTEENLLYDGSEFTRERLNEPEVTVQQWQPLQCGECGKKFALLTDEVTESGT